ncbi:hypothetical protein T4B_7419 [Trichinella pseudospiralis]|uniref:Uncharacterized protein n=1 Tax=Trichinella pseudospiralis TaxID=6337 RepID=A0A0V1F410_TRIPS|nr:hypothetical protein T4B_11697 [Trichinella pseudospiralis]KRY80922.1 hypothetical protein T4B_7419 [Trichinella pseudospiralis]
MTSLSELSSAVKQTDEDSTKHANVSEYYSNSDA